MKISSIKLWVGMWREFQIDEDATSTMVDTVLVSWRVSIPAAAADVRFALNFRAVVAPSVIDDIESFSGSAPGSPPIIEWILVMAAAAAAAAEDTR